MKPFMGEDFLLSTATAKTLYHDYAEKLPILDYHCHINPQDIAEDKTFENITQIWLGGDHYKWRQLRSNGVEEVNITGPGEDWEKFEKWAETLPKLVGNPLYHWSHMELKRYFGYDGVLNRESAKEVWLLCNSKLHERSMSAREIIKRSHVALICTTDDPADDLKWHQMIAADPTFDTIVLPAWRPEKAMDVEKEGFIPYLSRLSLASQVNIQDFSTLKEALRKRLDFFAANGCCVSDHSLDYLMYVPATDSEVDSILQRRLSGSPVTKEEALKYRTAFLLFAGREYHRRGWAMQIHFGCRRNNNTRRLKKLGPDTGFDAIGDNAPPSQTAEFLDALDQTGELPKTILYSLNPNDNAAIGSMIGCFQDDATPGKIQQGSAWWFNDHKTGMVEQLTSLANLGCLGNFIGMLTDSRSLLSYTRHEYFRRILCDLIGGWVENGEYPYDRKNLRDIIEGICYYNAVRFFGFRL